MGWMYRILQARSARSDAIRVNRYNVEKKVSSLLSISPPTATDSKPTATSTPPAERITFSLSARTAASTLSVMERNISSEGRSWLGDLRML